MDDVWGNTITPDLTKKKQEPEKPPDRNGGFSKPPKTNLHRNLRANLQISVLIYTQPAPQANLSEPPIFQTAGPYYIIFI